MPPSSTARAPHGLPAGDAHIDALPPALRTAIAQHWSRRVTSELQVSLAFTQLAPWLRSLHADTTVVTMMERAAAEEIAHADLCLHLAEVYAGTSVATPAVPFEMPRFGFDKGAHHAGQLDGHDFALFDFNQCGRGPACP